MTWIGQGTASQAAISDPVGVVPTDVDTDVVLVPSPVPDPEPIDVPVELPEQTGQIDACGSSLEWTTDGGRIRHVVVDDHEAAYEMQPLWSWALSAIRGQGGPWRPYGEPPGPAVLSGGDAEYLSLGSGALDRRGPDAEVVSASAEGVVLRGVTSDGIEVTRRISVTGGDPCMLAVDVTWRNTSATPYSEGVWMSLHDEMPGSAGRYGNAVRPFAMADGDFETWNNLDKLTENEPMTGKVDWLAVADRYFTLVLVPTGQDVGTAVFSPVQRGEVTKHGVHYRISRTLEPGEAHSETFSMYIGEKEHGILKGIAPGLNKLVQLGWFAFFGRILLFLLHMFYGVVGNWGLSIILLTLLVKGLFFPLTQASFRSSQAMQAIQPKLKEIREQYKDSPEELNKQTLAMFRDNGVNPLAGCLPMFIQLPVWIALYNVLLSSVDLYHVEFLYLRDLSSVDPYMAMPLVVVGLMLVQQQFMPTGNMDPTQARMMKMMPLIFGFFFFTFPSGLVVYIFVNMVLTILQQWWIKRNWRTVSA